MKTVCNLLITCQSVLHVCKCTCFQINNELCKTLGIDRSVTAAYHPQTNGLDERTNQTVKTRLGKLTTDHGDDWDSFIDDVAFSIRTQPQASTKYSPFFLMFGRHPRTPLEMESADEEMECVPQVTEVDLDTFVQQKLDKQNSIHQKVCHHIQKNFRNYHIDANIPESIIILGRWHVHT